MATIARQPFAPLDGARLQTLTSLKNRQNGTSLAPLAGVDGRLHTSDTEALKL